MTVPDQTCQEICTAIASTSSMIVQAVGVCDYVVSNPLSDVTVTGCVIEGANTHAINSTLVLVSVITLLDFTAVESGSSVPESFQCEAFIDFIITAAEFPASVSDDLPCTANLTCTARYAGFEPVLTPDTSAEEFVVTVSGTITCTSCLPATVNVQLCPSTS